MMIRCAKSCVDCVDCLLKIKCEIWKKMPICPECHSYKFSQVKPNRFKCGDCSFTITIEQDTISVKRNNQDYVYMLQKNVSFDSIG